MMGPLALLFVLPFAPSSQATPELIVSANDGKFVRDQGRGTYPPGSPSDSLVLLDVARKPKIMATIDVQHSVHGPPQSVAVTPDGKWAFVSAPDTYDYDSRERTTLQVVQVVDLNRRKIVQRLDVGAHPQAVAVTPDGTRLLVATTAGNVVIARIGSMGLKMVQTLDLGAGLLGSIAVRPDGKYALVADREAMGLTVLDLSTDPVTIRPERVSSGVTPYAVDISGDGRWAVVSNVGLAAIDGRRGDVVGDADTITLVDTSSYPFRAVQHLTVPSVPEGVAISGDGKVVAALCMNGSHLPPGKTGHAENGVVRLFRIRNGRAFDAGTYEVGPAPQGLVFTRDDQRLIVQHNVERALGVWKVTPDGLVDTGTRVALSGGPTSIRSQPR
ncbi:MAG: YncE family protein [Myxococcota bacterium]